jgi:hypothetical protein
MQELEKDLFESMLDDDVDAICITTNGNYTGQGMAVMGAGCAREAKERYPKLPVNLGKYLKLMGSNIPYIIGAVDAKGKYLDIKAEDIVNRNFKCLILSFPTKNHFKENSSLELIEQSCKLLVEMANKHNLKKIMIPRPGSGLGRLDWQEVKSKISNLLDDRFVIVSKGENK